MTGRIHGGGFMVARKIFTSEVWAKDPLYLKAWIWIIGRASFAHHHRNGYTYQRGEFVTTYSEIIKALTYRQNRKQIKPSLKKARFILEWFADQGMIQVEALRADEKKTNPPHSKNPRTRADTRAETRAYLKEGTRAYLGLKIIVINYDSYQDSESYKGRPPKGEQGQTPGQAQGHNNNKGHIKRESPPDFFELKKRYPDPSLIDKCFAAIATTRKSGKVADSILLACLQKWDRYPAEQVEAGIKTYLEKDYAGQGRDEKYLLGIIRNQNGHKPQDSQQEFHRPKIFSVNDPEAMAELERNE
jgi:hypothetical protein